MKIMKRQLMIIARLHVAYDLGYIGQKTFPKICSELTCLLAESRYYFRRITNQCTQHNNHL